MDWYALRSKPHKENALWEQLLAHRIDVFFPQVMVKPVNPRARTRQPYFPGYLFVHLELEELGFFTLQWMPFSLGLVSFDGQPAIVPENLIRAIQRRVEEINAAGGEQLAELRQGDAVRIQSGPFAGYEAIFDTKLTAAGRIRVLIDLLSRQAVVDLPVAQIRKK